MYVNLEVITYVSRYTLNILWQAGDHCARLNSTLVYPDDREEYEAVEDLITKHGAGSGIWTGLRYGEKAIKATNLVFRIIIIYIYIYIL